MSKNGPLYDDAKDANERLYFINKIPYKYWKSKHSDVSFSNMSYTHNEESKLRVTAAAQDDYYKSITTCIDETKNVRKFAGSFVCISSSPSEEHSMAAGVSLATHLIQKNPTATIGIVDLSLFYQVDRSQPHDIVIVHNVTSDSTRDRIQHARDYINWATRTALCVLCTSGRNPLEMCYEVLRMPANMVLFSDERSSKRTLNY